MISNQDTDLGKHSAVAALPVSGDRYRYGYRLSSSAVLVQLMIPAIDDRSSVDLNVLQSERLLNPAKSIVYNDSKF